MARLPKIALTTLLGLGACLAAGSGLTEGANPAAQVASAPTPFPTDARDWPGQGAIRVFGYMSNYRQSFWNERERKQGSVVFTGDSLIARWKTLADDLPGMRVANRGMDAEVTRGLLFRFKEDVLALHPKAVVMLIGTNDLSARQDTQMTRSNIVEMLDMAEQASPAVPIVLCTLPPRADPKSPIDPQLLIEANRLIASAAQGHPHVVIFDTYALLSDPDGSPHAAYFVDDKLHLSAAGHKRFRDALVPVLKRFDAGS